VASSAPLLEHDILSAAAPRVVAGRWAAGCVHRRQSVLQEEAQEMRRGRGAAWRGRRDAGRQERVCDEQGAAQRKGAGARGSGRRQRVL
jgi:hypothetical protein